MTELHPILDIKSRVSIAAHVRYQMMERFVPTPGGGDSKRRGQRGADDLLTTPRLPFQQIVTAVAMTRVEHADGNIEPLERMTLSNPVLDEREIIEGLFAVIASLPVGESELVMFGGANHDMPLLVVRAMSYGLTSPKGWDWMAFGSQGKVPHLGLLRAVTGAFKLKAIHMVELAGLLDVPAKVSDVAWSTARHIKDERWGTVQTMCECDVITAAQLFATWRTLLDGHCPVDTAHNRICRKVEELRPHRGYTHAFTAKRAALFERRIIAAKAKLETCSGAYAG